MKMGELTKLKTILAEALRRRNGRYVFKLS